MFKHVIWPARLKKSDRHPDIAFNPVLGEKSAVAGMIFWELLVANQ